MNKQLILSLLIATAFASIPLALFAPPKKKITDVKKNKTEDLDKIFKDAEKQNKKLIENEKNKQLEAYKKPENWKLKKYFKDTPSSFKEYYETLLKFKTLHDPLQSFIKAIQAHHTSCNDLYKLKSDIENHYSSESGLWLDKNNCPHFSLYYEHLKCAEEMSLFMCLFGIETQKKDEKYFKIARSLLKKFDYLAQSSHYVKTFITFTDYNYAAYREPITSQAIRDAYKTLITYSETLYLLKENVYSKLIEPIESTRTSFNQLNETNDVEKRYQFASKMLKQVEATATQAKDLDTDLSQELSFCETVSKHQKKEKKHQENEKKLNTKEIIPATEEQENTINIDEKLELENVKSEKIHFITEEQEPPFTTEHPRVSEWFTNPEKRLEEDYNTCGKDVCNLMIKFHAFTKKIDNFVLATAIKCAWLKKGQDIGSLSYNIPAEIYDLDTGKRYVGAISYGVDKDGLLFHRCFSEKIHQEIESIVTKNIDNSLYPTIQELDNFENPKYIEFQSDKDITVKQNDLLIEITDKPNNMIIKLCKPIPYN